MDSIPVTFEFDGKEHHGFLSRPSGAGEIWYLMVNNFFWGQLIKTERSGWRFASPARDMEDYADLFSAVVIAWYQ